MEADFSDQFQAALSRINAVLHDAERSLQDKVGQGARALDMRIEYPSLPALSCSPSLTALSDPIATEFGGAAFASSWTRRLSLAEQDELKTVVRSQFEAIIQKLAQTAREELEKTTRFIMEHFRFHASHSFRLAIDQKQAIISAYRSGNNGGSQTAERTAFQRPEMQLKQMERTADAYKGIAADLITISIDDNK
jgi:hypothetical protein